MVPHVVKMLAGLLATDAFFQFRNYMPEQTEFLEHGNPSCRVCRHYDFCQLVTDPFRGNFLGELRILENTLRYFIRHRKIKLAREAYRAQHPEGVFGKPVFWVTHRLYSLVLYV